MLTLSNLATRIERLEQETYHDEGERLSTWYSMVKWQYFIYLHGDNWHDVFEKLPKDDEIRRVYDSLMWFPIWKFSDVLPSLNDNWLSEKVQISLGAWLSVAFEEGYTPESLFCREALDDCLKFVSNALTNDDYWTKFHEQKRKEQETWELKLKYRRQAHEGSILPEGKKWLEKNDSTFWAHFLEKPKSVKSSPVENSTPQLPEVALPKNDISPVGNPTPYTVSGGEISPPYTVSELAPNGKSEYVTAHWAGLDEGWLVDSLDGTLPVYRNRLYKFSPQTWGNIQADNYLKVRWHKVDNE